MRSHTLPLIGACLLLALTSTATSFAAAPEAGEPDDSARDVADGEISRLDALEEFVRQRIGEPRMIEVAENVFVAVAFDIANVVIVRTSEGNIVIDAGSCTARAEEIREAAQGVAPGPVRALVYTHGDIEQTGGAGVWVTDGETEIWGAAGLEEQFLRQCILLQYPELRRAIHQFGLYLPEGERTPSALGRLPELAHFERLPDIRMPTHVVEGEDSFAVGDVEVRLFRAPGASPDHLAVWLPAQQVLVAGDNFMQGFPELASMRGNPHRSVDAWIASLDRMRRLAPTCLVGGRHAPVTGLETVQQALTDYRDALQWARDTTLRGLRDGTPVETLAAEARLPERLATSPYLAEFTATLTAAVRAIYADYAGCFDETLERLAPLEADDAARREVELMGGAERVLSEAEQAQAAGEPRFAAHLLDKLQKSCALDDDQALRARFATAWAAALDALAEDAVDSSSRAYLASLAAAARETPPEMGLWPCPTDATLRQVPIDAFFDRMALQLKTENTRDLHEVVWLNITDEETLFVVTIRGGILEVVEGEPLPLTPKPSAIVSTDGLTWRKLCMGVANPTAEMLKKRIHIRGSARAAREFVSRFECHEQFMRPEAPDERKLTATGRRPLGGP